MERLQIAFMPVEYSGRKREILVNMETEKNKRLSDDDLSRGIADRVRMHRQNLGMTQREFAKECGMEMQLLSRIERGYRSSLENYYRIASYLNVTMDYIICGQDAADSAENLLLGSIDNIRRAMEMIKH